MIVKNFKWQAISLCLIVIVAACTKIETTNLGTGLIPLVDNINTFETILPIVSNNYIPDPDSTRINAAEDHVVGTINDPMFGNATAVSFFELKPNYFPFSFGHPDSIGNAFNGFDSAVLVLPYKGYFGDSLASIQFKLYEVNEQMLRDSTLRPTYTLKADGLSVSSKQWSATTFGPKTIRDLDDSLGYRRGTDTTKKINQIRIPIDSLVARAFFYKDSASTYHSDTTFRNNLKGFALVAQSVNGSPGAVVYFNLGTATLDFYYRKKAGTVFIPNDIDTGIVSFSFNSLCGHAVKYDVERTGAQVTNYQVKNFETGTDKIFIQNAPGTYAKLFIKGMDTFRLTNRVINRAEIRITQLPSDGGELQPYGTPGANPSALYLDVADTNGVFRGIPYDLSPTSTYYCYPGTVDFGYFGGITTKEIVDGTDNIAVYRFNISRYVQGIVTRGDKWGDTLRLSAPFYNVYKNCSSGGTAYPSEFFPFLYNGATIDRIGPNRIRLAGGNHPNPKYKMQLRIIYSKL